jgi:hypothetical protein
MGADTTVPLAQINYPGSNLEAGSLYLVDHSGTWRLLRPLLVAQHCTECNTLSTFRPDKYERATGCVTRKASTTSTTSPTTSSARPSKPPAGFPKPSTPGHPSTTLSSLVLPTIIKSGPRL